MCRYSDDGIGFDWNEKIDAPGKGIGLHNIITRIRSLGGNFHLDDANKKGFHIRFELQTITRNDAGKKKV
jgi:signal transduction histidine kinase